MHEKLTHELLKRIFGNLGIIAGRNFGKLGLVSLKPNKTLVIQEDDGRKDIPVWIAQIQNFKVALTKLEPEFILLFTNEELTFGFYLYLDKENEGNFFQLSENKWLPISVLHQLNLTVAFEMITQEGLVWQQLQGAGLDLLYNRLVSFVESLEDA
jgi:hypothetical protein